MYGDNVPKVVWLHASLLESPDGLERAAWAIAHHMRRAPLRVFVGSAPNLPRAMEERGEAYAHLANDPTLARLQPWSDAELTTQALLEHCTRLDVVLSILPEEDQGIYAGVGLTVSPGDEMSSAQRAWHWAQERGASLLEVWKAGPMELPGPLRATVPMRVRDLQQEENKIVRARPT